MKAFVFVAKHTHELVCQRDWDHNYEIKVNSNKMDSPGLASPDLSTFPVQFSCPEQGFLLL